MYCREGSCCYDPNKQDCDYGIECCEESQRCDGTHCVSKGLSGLGIALVVLAIVCCIACCGYFAYRRYKT